MANQLTVFVSWSMELSRDVAAAFKSSLENVPLVKVWFSPHAIQGGDDWNNEIEDALKTADIGILCVTSENFQRPWVMYEAGALSRGLHGGVVPYLVDFRRAAVEMGPLTRLHALEHSPEGFKGVLERISKALEVKVENSLKVDFWLKSLWQDFDSEVQSAIARSTHDVNASPKPKRSTEEMLEEVVNTNREILRSLVWLSADAKSNTFVLPVTKLDSARDIPNSSVFITADASRSTCRI